MKKASKINILIVVLLAGAAAAHAGESNLGGFEAAAGSPETERAVAAQKEGLAMKAAQRAAEKNPCAEHTELDKIAFGFSFSADGAGSKTEMTFRFQSCDPYYASESPHGRLETSESIRRYKDEKTGYVLVIETPAGADAGELTIVKEVRASAYGSAPIAALTGQTAIALVGRLLPNAAGTDTVKGTATLTPQPPAQDGPTGCQ